MSVSDVCELKGLLKTDTDEKEALRSQLEEKNRIARGVEKAVGAALDAGQECERKQQKLVDDSQSLANKFELLTFQVSEIKKENTSPDELVDILRRMKVYLAARDELRDEVQGVANEAARLHEKLRTRLEDPRNADVEEEIAALEKENVDAEASLQALLSFDAAAEEDVVAQKQSRLEQLLKETAELQGSDLDQKRAALDARIPELDERASAGRAEAQKVMAGLKTTIDASTERVSTLENKLRDQKDLLQAATKDGDDAAAALLDAQQKEQGARDTAAQHVVDEGKAEAAFKEAEDQLNDAKKREVAVRQQVEVIAKEQAAKDAEEAAARAPPQADGDLDPDALQRQVDDLQSNVVAMEREIAALTAAMTDGAAGEGADADGADGAGGAGGELRAVAAELAGLRTRVDDAQNETNEHRRVHAELQGGAAGAAQLREEATRARDAATAEHAALKKDVEALMASVQTAIDSLATAHASQPGAAAEGQDVDALQRHRDDLAAAVVRAEEGVAGPADPAQQAELDNAHARRYIADELIAKKQQVQALEEEIKVADIAFQKRMSNFERRFKEDQTKLTDETKALDGERALAERQYDEVVEEVRNMAGGPAMLALLDNDPRAASAAADDDVDDDAHRHGGDPQQGRRTVGGARTTPAGAWGTSKPAEIDGNFRSGVEDGSGGSGSGAGVGMTAGAGSGLGGFHFNLLGSGSGHSEEAEELLRAQHAHSSAVHASAPAAGGGGGKGRSRGGGSNNNEGLPLPGPLPGPPKGTAGDGAVMPQTRKLRGQGRN
jgi:hypothetical protein